MGNQAVAGQTRSLMGGFHRISYRIPQDRCVYYGMLKVTNKSLILIECSFNSSGIRCIAARRIGSK